MSRRASSFCTSLLHWLSPLLLAIAGSAYGASFSISPVRIELSAQETTSAVTVTNTGDEPVSVQLRVFSWRQEANEDRLEPTRELVATPPVFSVPPGESQIVRVGFRRPPQGTAEVPFRAIFEEIPGPPPPSGGPALRINLRISIPVFYAPAEGLKSALSWKFARQAPGQLRLTVRNTGTANAHLGDFAVATTAGAPPVAEQKNFAYVLPGAERSFTINVPAADSNNTRLQLRTTLDGQRTEIEVPVE
jgi:fimbrial chaperone protein